MPVEDPKDLEKIDHEIRVNELKEKARELVGGDMHETQFEEMPPEVEEQFWENVVAYESAPFITDYQRLVDRAVAMPPSDQMDDETLHAKLWEVIETLAELGVSLHFTNHMSDRQLYDRLVNEALREEHPDLSGMEGGCWHIDFMSGSDEDIEASLRYYADEDERRRWKEQFPNDVIPPHEDPPWDRDKDLP